MIADYLAQVQRCRTPNEVNALHIQFENGLTPAEMFELINIINLARAALERGAVDDVAIDLEPTMTALKALPEKHLAYVYRWIDTLATLMLRTKREIAEPYVRQRRGPYASFYSTGGDTASKCLAICFAGAGQRMMMPVAVFLQHLPASRYDVVVLRDVARNGYRTGIPGIGATLEEVVDRVGMAQRSYYESVVSLGVSAGGLPAIWAYLQLELDKGIAVGANHPSDPRWQMWGGDGVAPPFQRYLARFTKTPDMLFVHGADEAHDREAAAAFAGILPSRTLAVVGNAGKPSGHNALYTLLLRSQLEPFLERALTRQTPWDELSSIAAGTSVPVAAPATSE
jgi:hypothetical protein